jgi:hypothetical protein
MGFCACTAVFAQTRPNGELINRAFAKADTDHGGTVGLSEAKKFGITLDMFRKADAKKNAALDKNEFAVAISYQFAWANADRDGTLEWKEASMAGVRSKEIFDAADANHDGKLDPAEYLAALVAQAK